MAIENERRPVDEGPSLPRLLVDLQDKTTRLVRDEVALIRAEIRERISALGSGLAMVVAGIIVSLPALLILLMGLAELINEFLPEDLRLWLGYVIVGLVILVIGGIMLMRGMRNLRAVGETPRSAESLRRDREMVKEHVSS